MDFFTEIKKILDINYNDTCRYHVLFMNKTRSDDYYIINNKINYFLFRTNCIKYIFYKDLFYIETKSILLHWYDLSTHAYIDHRSLRYVTPKTNRLPAYTHNTVSFRITTDVISYSNNNITEKYINDFYKLDTLKCVESAVIFIDHYENIFNYIFILKILIEKLTRKTSYIYIDMYIYYGTSINTILNGLALFHSYNIFIYFTFIRKKPHFTTNSVDGFGKYGVNFDNLITGLGTITKYILYNKLLYLFILNLVY